MASLFHELDTASLEKDPNLKFDPQNPSGHLNDEHPTFQQLKEGLTPEQIEILENVTQVDGFEVDETIDADADVEFVDPETGEIEKDDDEFTLDELGFIDPSNLRTITMEAFCSLRLEHVNEMIKERYNELAHKRNQIAYNGFIGRLEANNVNDLLGGQLYDNVVMESFTNMPTKVNFNLVMEEIDAGKAALAAGGAIVGAALLYKLVKWYLNAWNKNSVANGSIGNNVKAIQERKDRLKNADNIINVAKESFSKAKADYDKAKAENIKDSELAKALSSVTDLEQLNNQAKASEVVAAIVDANAKTNLTPHYSNLWNSLIAHQAVNINGGQLNVNQDFITKLQQAAQACQEIANTAKAKIEDIQTTAANLTVNSSGDDVYKKAIGVIAEFAKVCGFNMNTGNFNSSSSEFSQHIMSNVTAKLNTPVPDKAYNAAVEIFSEDTFAVISDEFTKDIEAFGESLKTATEGKKEGILRKRSGENSVNTGDAVQKDSRLNEYNKAATNFRGAMNVMRGIHSIRNNVGRGLNALSTALNIKGL